MKKMISLIYDQIFVENLDFSLNDALGEDFAQFVYKYISAYHLDLDS